MSIQNLEKYQLIIFDRDGVINKSPVHPERYIMNSSSLIIEQKTIALIVSLQQIGIKIAVATNQQGIGKGLISWDQINEIHEKINTSIIQQGGRLIDFYVCSHLAENNCDCRKPKAGLIENILADYSTERAKTLFIGDQPSDESAAATAGVEFLYERNLWDLFKSFSHKNIFNDRHN